MKVSIENVLIFFTTVFVHITNACHTSTNFDRSVNSISTRGGRLCPPNCPNLLDPYAKWYHHNRNLEGPKFKLDDCHNNYLIGNKYRDISIFNLKFSNKIKCRKNLFVQPQHILFS